MSESAATTVHGDAEVVPVRDKWSEARIEAMKQGHKAVPRVKGGSLKRMRRCGALRSGGSFP